MDTHDESGLPEDQMSMLQDMILEMKEGFQTALKELVKIQDKEEGETYHSRNLQQQQQRQLDDLTETIHEIKDQLTSLTKSVKHIKDEQITLKDNLEEIRSNRGSSQESKTNNDRGRLEHKIIRPAPKFDDINDSSRKTYEIDDKDVTVTACKSLILTQNLSDKCLKLSLNQSSDEDEVQESQRVPYYTHKTSGAVLGLIENRRHSMPSSTTSQSRTQNVGIVAQRQKAVKELADLERAYCSQLWSLIHSFLTPLQTAGFLSARELGTLFPPYLDQLYAEHYHICTGLQNRLVQWTYMGTVADLLTRITDSHNLDSVLSLYKEYVDDLLSAVTCLRRVQAQSSKFRSFLKAVNHSSEHREDNLMSLLLAPVQHIPKYLLQLQQVFHHTPPNHPDFPLLQTSLCRLQSFVEQLNEDLSGIAEFLNQDRHVWSGSNSRQMLSARDSGVHSNSTEDDNVMPVNNFCQIKRSHVPSEWLDNPRYSVHHHRSDDIIRQRHMRASAGRFSALSQPDLTVYNNLSSYSSDPHIFAHIPRSRSTIPTGGVDSGDEAARGRQYHKFKVKRRNQSPVDYTSTTKGHLHRSLSPHVRPSSAIDFLSHSHHHHQQYQHQSNYKDLPVQSRKLQYQEHQQRSHSILDSHVTDLNYRPTIISRKHLRRPHHPIPVSANFWAETTTLSALPFRVEHQRLPLSARDLRPQRPSLYNTSDVLDGDDEHEEDDTRASDTHSLGTNGSHPYSSGQGSNNSHDLDLDFYQGHIGELNHQVLMQGHNYSHSPEFSSADVTASLARKLYDAQKGTAKVNERLLIKQTSNDKSEAKPISIFVEQSSGSSEVLPIPVNESIREQYMAFSNDNNSKRVSTMQSEQVDNSQNSALLTNKTNLSKEGVVKVCSQERDGNVSSRSKINTTISNFPNNINNQSEYVNEIRQISESNRQFQMSESARSSSVNKVDEDNNFLMNDSSEIHSDNWLSPVRKKNLSLSNSDTSGSSSPIMKLEVGRAKAYLLSRNIKTGSSYTNKALAFTGSHGVTNIESGYLPKRYLQPLLSSNSESKDDGEVSPEVTSLTSSQRNRLDRSISSSSNATYHSFFPDTSHDTFQLSRIASSPLDNHQLYCKTNPLDTNSISNHVNDTVESSKATANTGVSGDTDNYKEIISYPDSFELPPIGLDDPAPDKDKPVKKGDLRRKNKDGGKLNFSDVLPKAIHDPVNARKKIHFKSSIRNLFSKKKGQVILADVERKVVKEMGTATAEDTSSAWPQNLQYFRKSKIRNHLVRISCAPQKTLKKSEFDTKKGQLGTSCSSLAKLSKNFHLDTKHKLQNDGEHKEGNLSELDQFQQQNVLECLKTRNKRHGIVIDSNDTQFTNTLDMSIASTRKARQVNNNKLYLTGNYYYQGQICETMFQQRHESDFTCEAENTGVNVRNKSTLISNTESMSKHCQGETVDKELTGLIDSHINVGKNKILHTISKGVKEPAIISKSKVRTEKYCNQNQGESHENKKSHFSNHDLCQHCQKCEMRQKENVVFGCEGAICEQKLGLSSLKGCGTGSDKHSTAEYLQGKSQISTPSLVGHFSSNDLLKELKEEKKSLVTEKSMQFPLDVEPGSTSLTESIKICRDSDLACRNDKFIQMNSSHPLTGLEQQKEQLGERCQHCTSFPIQKQNTPLEYQMHQSSKLMAHNMPDVTKISKDATCSDKIERQNVLIETSKGVDLVSAADTYVGERKILSSAADTYVGERKILSSAGSEVYNSMGRCSSTVLNISLLNSYDDKMSVTVSQSDMSLAAAKLVVTTSADYCSSALPQAVSSETRSDVMEENKASEQQLPRSRSTVLSKVFPSKDCSQSFIIGETQNEMTVNNLPIEDKDLFNHRYRLYYDDETTPCQSVKKLENPKSLKALSASSVIAENFKQLPRDSCLSYDKMQRTSDQQSEQSDRKKQQTENNLACKNSFSETKMNRHSDPKLSLQSSTTQNLSYENPPLAACSIQPVSQFSIYRPFYSDLLVNCHKKMFAGNSNPEVHQSNSSFTSPAAKIYDLQNQCSDYGALPHSVHADSQKTESSQKLYQTNTYLEKGRNASNSDVNCSKLHTTSIFDNDKFSDESSSYKPTNLIAVTDLLLSDVPQYHSSKQHIRSLKSNSGYRPSFQLKSSSTLHHSTSEHEVTSSSLNISPCSGTENYNHESQTHMMSRNECKTRNDFQFLESNSHNQSGNDSLFEEKYSCLRPSSPSDFFSIRPYMNYTASKASSDSGIRVHSDHVRSSTPNGMKSALKVSSLDKLDKGRKDVGNKNVKRGSEKDSKCCKSPNKCAESSHSTDAAEYCHKNYSRRSRHSDGIKYTVQDKKMHPPLYPRYSADSNSLISNAFLQKMAHLSQHTTRSVSHSHIDENCMNTSARHASIHVDYRKTKSPTETESNVVLKTNASRSFRITSCTSKSLPLVQPLNSHVSKDETPQMSYPHHGYRSNSAKADTSNIHASPDLLPSNDGMKEEAVLKEKSPLSKKAHSFFSKLTHSPITLFYRDAKSSNAPK